MTALEWALEFLRTETPEAERAVVDSIFAAGAEAQREADLDLMAGTECEHHGLPEFIRASELVTLPKGEG
jgi:hypothetical protein